MVSETAEGRVVYTVDEVAVLLRISRGSAFDAVRTGAIPSIRIGRRILVPRVALERMLGQGGLGDDPARAPVEA